MLLVKLSKANKPKQNTRNFIIRTINNVRKHEEDELVHNNGKVTIVIPPIENITNIGMTTLYLKFSSLFVCLFVYLLVTLFTCQPLSFPTCLYV